MPMDGRSAHYWVEVPGQGHRAAIIAGLPLPPPLLPVTSAHRRLRGPYTAAGTIVRGLAAAARQGFPALVTAHQIEILCVAPELRDQIPATHETLTSLAVPEERSRFYSRLRTLRIAHGLTEFLRDYVAGVGGPRSLVVDHVDSADQTDQEFISVLLGRLDPDLLTLVIGAGGPVGQHPGAQQPTGQHPAAQYPARPEPLAGAVARYAHRCDARPPRPVTGLAAVTATVTGTAADSRRLAAAFVATDCTDDTPELVAAYLGRPAADRARLHDARAAELTAVGERSLRLGAIPYHLEHGRDPSGAGAEALRQALLYCLDMGFYEAVVDFGRRGRTVIERPCPEDLWWDLTMKVPTPLAALGRPAEAEEIYEEARATSTSARVHMQAAYGTAMLYTRHHAPERRDDQRALGWINQAIAIAALLPDIKERALSTVFNQNGLALIKSHLGEREEALRLVSDGLLRLDADLDPGEHRLHRSVLRYNRAQLYSGMGRLAEALAEYTAVIEEDPHYAEYHFDRAGLLRRLGRDDEAMAEYETAMRLSPPFPELYYNRADLRSAQGDRDGALADFSYVIEIDPDCVDAYINRAGILMGMGQAPAARRDVTAGLAVAPADPHLLCLLARLELDDGHPAAALASLDTATAADASFAQAWGTRAAVLFETGDPAAALADLNHAIDLAADPALLFNRGSVHQAMRNWAAAEADFTSALESEPGDPDAWLRRARCREHLGNADGARDDRRQFAALAPERAAEAVTVMACAQ
jgi:tetratricopeptide (TPR) repeat protein